MSQGKKLLFVCSGNSCRSPMAMIVASSMETKRGIFVDSAAGNLSHGSFKSSANTSSNAKAAIEKVYGTDSFEYDMISRHRPKPLSVELMDWADHAIFLGQQFYDNAIKEFSDEYQEKMMLYTTYKSKKTGQELHEVPDPFDGDHWEDYYGPDVKWPGKKLASYKAVLRSMKYDFQPALSKKLWSQ